MTSSTSPTPMVVWSWVPAIAALAAAIPAIVVAATVDVQMGAALALGIIPALVVGVSQDRRARSKILASAVVLGVPIVVGSAVAPWPIVAVLTILVLPILAVVSAGRLERPGLSMMLVLIAPALVGVGLSLDGIGAGVRLALLFLGGALATFIVAMLIPPRLVPPRLIAGSDRPWAIPGLDYGVAVGTVGALTALIGFSLDFDHVGWACTAALLATRPHPEMRRWRTVGRFVSVVVGGTVGVVLVHLGAPGWVMGAAIAVVVMSAAATRGSRWYILPTFSTFLVLVMLTTDGSGVAANRLGELIGETVLGLVVAAVGTLVLGVYRRRAVAPVALLQPDPHPELPVDPDSDPETDRPVHLRASALGLVFVGGMAGTGLRYLIEELLPTHGTAWPWATFIVNLAGAFLLGMLLETLVRLGADDGWRRRIRLLVGTGFCGAFTTYSTFALETTMLAHRGAVPTAVAYAVISVVLGIMFAWLGIVVGSRAGRRAGAVR